MSEKWWDMSDDELDDLFREASDKVDIPFDSSAFDKLRHKMDNKPEEKTLVGTKTRRVLPLIALLLLVGVGVVYRSMRNEIGFANNSNNNQEKVGINTPENLKNAPNNKKENPGTNHRQINEIDDKTIISSNDKNNKNVNSIKELEKGTHLSNQKSNTAITTKSNEQIFNQKSTEQRVIENKKTASNLFSKTPKGTTVVKNQSEDNQKLITKEIGNETSILKRDNISKEEESSENVTKATISTEKHLALGKHFSSKNWNTPKRDKSSSASLKEEKNNETQGVKTNIDNILFFQNNNVEESVPRTIFANVNYISNKNTKAIPTDLMVDLPPFIDSLPRTKPVSKISRFGIRFALSPDINAIENFDYLGFGGSLGLLMEYRINKRFALQTGIGYSTKKYVGDFDNYHAWPDWTKGHPSKPIEVDGRCKVIDIPINVRFNLLQKPNHSWFISSGVSSYIMLNETYIYTYAWAPTKITDWSDNSSFYASTLNFSVGFEKKISKHLSFQAEPYLKTPLKGVGRGLVNLYSSGVFFSTKYSF